MHETVTDFVPKKPIGCLLLKGVSYFVRFSVSKITKWATRRVEFSVLKISFWRKSVLNLRSKDDTVSFTQEYEKIGWRCYLYHFWGSFILVLGATKKIRTFILTLDILFISDIYLFLMSTFDIVLMCFTGIGVSSNLSCDDL